MAFEKYFPALYLKQENVVHHSADGAATQLWLPALRDNSPTLHKSVVPGPF